jgi:hypothetical protein
MIQGFLPIVQDDLSQIWNYVTDQGEFRNDDQKQRTSLAALRMLGTSVMIVGAIVAVSAVAIVASNPVGAVLTVALGVGVYALGHDVFVMANNQSLLLNPNLQTLSLAGTVLLNKATYFFKKRGNVGSLDSFDYLTQGTFFPSLCNFILTRLQ